MGTVSPRTGGNGGRGHPWGSPSFTVSPGGAAPWLAVSPGVAAPSPGEDGVINIVHIDVQMLSTYEALGMDNFPIYGLRV